MKKDTLWRLARVLMVLLGVGILVYPSLSEYLSRINGSRATASYDDSILQLEQARLDEMLAQAQEYNRLLAESSMGQAPAVDDRGDPITPESYWELLNLDATGMMGYIEIPRLNLSIPIYHGTEEEVLQVGIGHLQNTSLPVGGANPPMRPFRGTGGCPPAACLRTWTGWRWETHFTLRCWMRPYVIRWIKY